MALDLKGEPKETVHLPSVHGGLSYLDTAPDWIIRPAPMAQIGLHAGSDDRGLHKAQQADIDRQMSNLLTTAMEVRSSPVVLEDARFFNGYVTLGERLLLNGASGSRVRVRFNRQNRVGDGKNALIDTIRRERRGGASAIPVWNGPSDGFDTAVELRNGFNFFHFLVETLGALSHFEGAPNGRPFRIILPKSNRSAQVAPFMRAFVDALFPALAPQVVFETRPRRFDRVRSVYSHFHYLSTMADPAVHSVIEGEGIDPRWARTGRDPTRAKLLGMCSYDQALRLLREQALRRLPEGSGRAMPRLVWIGRDDATATRARMLTGHEPLLEELKARGFETMTFEGLAPLEQVALMQSADVVISPHGAGFANMTFAKEGAMVIEIGTRQTQRHRWGDFLKCAHVSRCRYETVFADVAGVDDIARVPPMKDGLLGVHIGETARARILALVDEAVGR